MRLPRLLAIVPVLVALCLATALAQPVREKKALDVPFVPTDDNVVVQMLQVAKVTRDDLVYDLGSGDGRIVITAARRFGARGVGIDIDPDRVREAQENARAAGVEDRVRFEQGDIFTADIRPATVVTMYLLPEVNMRLRPKLLGELKPGTRIASHNYDLGDWAPRRTLTVRVGGTDHQVYFWVVPSRAARER